ncbi:MAG: SDR family NAD(P)-dependent oxidoreductase [Clostridia bacterium]|nr:SDR family NAD(P)-dependent oxidoreductase [Clostridia bacterium]
MITNKKIVLTGAGSGIGLEVLRLLAFEGGNTIFAVDKDVSRISGFGDNVIPYVIDVASKEGVDAIFEDAHKAMGTIDIFYANAGYPYYEIIDYVDWDRARRIFDTNVLSPIYSYEKYREYLKGKEGQFAITVSAIGKMAVPGYTLYSASKFAMHGFQQGLRFELPKNIKLTCLYPIATDTNFFKTANPKEFEKPFPVQKPDHVAKKMYEGLEKGAKSVNPSKLFSLAELLFVLCPPIKSAYLFLENNKLKRFLKK